MMAGDTPDARRPGSEEGGPAQRYPAGVGAILRGIVGSFLSRISAYERVAQTRDVYPERIALGEGIYRAVLEAVSSCGAEGCYEEKLPEIISIPDGVLYHALEQLGEDRMIRHAVHTIRRPLRPAVYRKHYSITGLGLEYMAERGYGAYTAGGGKSSGALFTEPSPETAGRLDNGQGGGRA